MKPYQHNSYLTIDKWLTYVVIAGCIFLLILGLFNSDLNNDLQSLLDIQTSEAVFSREVEDISETVQKAYVFRVIDGDTFELSNGIRVRMLNIDTPESVKPNTPVQCYSLEAKKKLQSLIEDKEVYLAIDKQKQDRYNRELRFVYLERDDATSQTISQSVNAHLVQKGYARSSIYSPNTTYKQEFNAYMQTAIENNRGVWGKCNTPFES